ncbi:hypothetical protein EJ05DRAFT_499268 [Pseudovirgaria hyperparasitica]|uniref:Rhodopsin domain-containing protein n=1 Tax=Pseudovirgaria hyperparasitica TaxID=470096 RepID=A0A6A6W9X5_9PEZI|nr:uncharacterized protein EJ05DRAFT_499268 [Pseudovirgaria hyperparasitica]KAF2758834.1 hypothetical protein EJ05DRAFT_499268 [Pseudovirgaria hyperparasitica]
MAAGRALSLCVASAVLLFTSVVSTLLRVYVRKQIVRAFGTDDWLIIVALCVFMGHMGCSIGSTIFGVGKHRTDISDDDAEIAYLLWWLCYLLYGTVLTIARISVGFFFLRITVVRWQRYLVFFTVTSNMVSGTAFICVVAFQCTPVSYYWKKVYPGSEGHCIPNQIMIDLGYLYGAACAACDMIFVALPAVLVWNLDMTRLKKFGLVPILGMAGFAGCCPLVRMFYLHHLGSPDFLYSTVDIATWSVLEVGLAITASSLATLRPLLRAWRGPISHYAEGSRRLYSSKSHTTVPVEFDRRIELTPKRLRSIEIGRAVTTSTPSEELPLHAMSPVTLVDPEQGFDHWKCDSVSDSPKRTASQGTSTKTADIDTIEQTRNQTSLEVQRKIAEIEARKTRAIERMTRKESW